MAQGTEAAKRKTLRIFSPELEEARQMLELSPPPQE
jgi:hypothetical protein